MPFVIEKSSACPASKPYGVFTKGTDHLHGCHPTEDAAKKQQAALYANVPDAASEVPMADEQRTDASPVEEELEDEVQQPDAENQLNPELEQRKAKLAMLDGTVERRDFAAEEMELREISNGKLKLTGYASVTETPYEVMDFSETIARGAFKRTLSNEPDVVLLLNHSGLPLARTKSGTLTLSEDVRGLHVDAELEPSDPDVQALRPKMDRGDLSEMSFAFRAVEQDWSEDYTKRTIREVSIHRGDVSMVTYGANSATSGALSVRSEDSEEEKPKRSPRVKASYIENAKAKRAHYRRYR